VIEGREVSSEIKKRLKQLLSRYPDVVDLTSSIAWDQMVMLDVKVLELPRQRLRELGVHWQSSPNGGIHAGAAWQLGSAGARLAQEGPVLGSGALFGMSDLLTARLQAMTQAGQAVLLAQPQLLARSGSPASFQAGGEVPYAFVDKDGKRTTLFKKYGVMLNVTPHIDQHGSIRAKVDVEVSSVDPSITTEAGPAMRVRKASTEFNIKSGQTLVLGGFISHEQVQDQRGFAGVHKNSKRQVELAIFVTPVIVTPDHPDMMARVTRAQTVEHWQLGPTHQMNVPIQGEPDDRSHRWHPVIRLYRSGGQPQCPHAATHMPSIQSPMGSLIDMLAVEIQYEDGRQQSLEVPVPAIIGKDADCEIRLAHWRVAKEQAKVSRLGEFLQIEDFGSLTGMRINGLRCAHHFPLLATDDITIGPCRLRMRWVQPVTESSVCETRHPDAAPIEDGVELDAQVRSSLHAELVAMLDVRKLDLNNLPTEVLKAKAREMLAELLERDSRGLECGRAGAGY